MSPGHNAHPRRRTPEGVENCVKAIFQLQQAADQEQDGSSVGNGAIAERLGITPASASAMVKRLAEEGLAEHVRYQGVRLTPTGERLALEMVRHHRLIELFLAEVVGMPWDKVHYEAEILEHHISEELEELIAAKLGQPKRDPHGDPIPTRDLSIEADDSIALDALEVGDTAVFERVSDSDAEMLRYLADRSITPGSRLVVMGREPFGGPISVEVRGELHVLGGQLLDRMRVRVEARVG